MSARRLGVLAVAVCGSALLFAGSAFGLSVTSFSPNSGLPNKDAGQACPGNTIMITGAGFVNDGSAVSVSFNGVKVPLGGLQVGSDSTLYAIVPDGATTGPITVTDAQGSVTAPGGVFYVNPCPQVSLATALANPSAAAGVSSTPSILGNKGVSPLSGPVGTTVTITGYSLLSVTGVSFGAVKAKFTITSPTAIKAIVPKGAKSGKIQLTYVINNTVSQGGINPDPTKNGNVGNPSAVTYSPKAFTVK